jgi:hypothetical protein
MSDNRTKLTEAEAKEILSLRGSSETQNSIAERFGISQATVHDIQSGRSWKHLSDPNYQRKYVPRPVKEVKPKQPSLLEDPQTEHAACGNTNKLLAELPGLSPAHAVFLATVCPAETDLLIQMIGA